MNIYIYTGFFGRSESKHSKMCLLNLIFSGFQGQNRRGNSLKSWVLVDGENGFQLQKASTTLVKQNRAAAEGFLRHPYPIVGFLGGTTTL